MLIKESVGGTYAADSEEEAEWDGFFGVVWVAQCFEEVLMFVCGLRMEICFDVVVDETNLEYTTRLHKDNLIDYETLKYLSSNLDAFLYLFY